MKKEILKRGEDRASEKQTNKDAYVGRDRGY